MTNPTPHKAEARILPFGPRPSRGPRQQPVPDLKRYQRPSEEPDDYRHRMAVNAAAFVATVLLIAGGLWVVDVMVQMRKSEDCVLSGRAGCAAIHTLVEHR